MRALALLLAVAALAVVLVPAHADAQERRVAVPVDYVLGADVYVALGTRDGLERGDTVSAFDGSAGALRGRMVARVVTVRRWLLTFAAERFAVAAGDTLWLALTRPPEPAAIQDTGRSGQAPGPPRGLTPRGNAGRLAGRVSVDFDAVASRLAAGETRTYTTPTVRVRLASAPLPGGVRLAANLRASRRWSGNTRLSDRSTVRLYDASVEKRLESLPVALRAGRFHLPSQTAQGYWDGISARYGNDFGISAAAGFLPPRGDEGFSVEIPRAAVIVDFRTDGPLRYSGEVGLHALRPRSQYTDQTFVALAQRVSWARLTVAHAAQVEQGSDGWGISVLRLDGSLRITSTLALRGGASRYRSVDSMHAAPLPIYPRDRANVSLGYNSERLGVSAYASRIRGASGRNTDALTLSAQAPRLLAGVGIAAYATGSAGDHFDARHFSAETFGAIREVRIRLGYRGSRYGGALSGVRSDGVTASLNFPLRDRVDAMLSAENWWDESGAGRRRLFSSVWWAF